VAKLGDFGESRDLREETMTIVGTPMYWCAARALRASPSQRCVLTPTSFISAPEILRSEPYDESADTFSFALTLVACFKRGRAYDATESFRMKDVERARQRPYVPPWLPRKKTGCPKSVAALIRKCWDEDGSKRPPFRRVVAELEREVERFAQNEAEAVAADAGAVAAGLSRDHQLLHEVRARLKVLRASFEAAKDAETDAEFVVELVEAVEELRSMSFDPIVQAALIDTHDDLRGFRGVQKDMEGAARKAAEAAARAQGPDAPPAEWTDDEVLEAVARRETLRGWVFACAREGAASEAAFAAALDAKLEDVVGLETRPIGADVESTETTNLGRF